MGVASKVVSACLRVIEFGCACIITGVLSKFFYVLGQGDGIKEPRLIFALSMAVISIVASLVLLPPAKYTFSCFPLDFSLFICWIVCYALLQDLAGTQTCQSPWYDDYWGYYWGRVWTTDNDAVVVADFGCSEWRVVLGFSFIIAMSWLISTFTGVYVCIRYYRLGARTVWVVRKLCFWKKAKGEEVEQLEHLGHTGNGLA